MSEKTKQSKEKSGALVPDTDRDMIRAALPDSDWVFDEAIYEPEAWMPFRWRCQLFRKGRNAPGDEDRWLDLRSWNPILKTGVDITALNVSLQRLGLPVPTLLAGPFPDPEHPGEMIAVTEVPKGSNLLLWALEGDIPHRIRAATALTVAAIDQLHGLTDALLTDPVGKTLPRRPLSVDLGEIIAKGGSWAEQPQFAEAIKRLKPVVDAIATPLVYTNDLYFPNFLRIPEEREEGYAAPFGWPGDVRATDRPITEFIIPWGWFGDPLLGLAKYWTYDCYPFVHTGLVERYLFEKGFTKKDFAPRLAVRALWTIQRELPVERPTEGPEYYDAQMGLLRYALENL